MKISLVSSRQDPGGSTIHSALLGLLSKPHQPYALEKHELSHCHVRDRLIYQDNIDRELDSDLIIFLSRHSSVNPVPVLTVHVTGNITTADFGGSERVLAFAAPGWMHAILRGLHTRRPEGYRVAYEVTHHGPSDLATPSLFVEVGSTEKEWRDEVAGIAVAQTVLTADPDRSIPLIGFGGTHYAARQTHISLNSRGAFGHIAHSREVPSLDADMISQMWEKTGAVAAYVDRKAIPGKDLANLDALIRSCNLPVLSEGDLIHFGDLSWNTYQAILSLADQILPGCRVAMHGQCPDGKPVRTDLDQVLLEEALRCNTREFLEGLDTIPLARLSTGKKPIWPSFITIEEIHRIVLHDLISLCVNIIRRGESTFVAGDHLTINRRRFDPERARDLGLPPGPLYSQLKNGSTVCIGDLEITPEMVQTSSETTIHIPGLEKYL
ncbi:MAG: D-tyrosyl-tRNA(Tyr) deacylase [Methanolinea sp.]|nr:D-tyrosyl-tRNA(Tyr) deacylase [Methanolinea sp.]